MICVVYALCLYNVVVRGVWIDACCLCGDWLGVVFDDYVCVLVLCCLCGG